MADENELSLDGAVNETGEAVVPVKRHVNPRFVSADRTSGADATEFTQKKNVQAFPKRNAPAAAPVMPVRAKETTNDAAPRLASDDAPVGVQSETKPAETKRKVASRFADPSASTVTDDVTLPAKAPVDESITLDAGSVNERTGELLDVGELEVDETVAPVRRTANTRFNFKQPVTPVAPSTRFSTPGNQYAKLDDLVDVEGEEAFDVKGKKPAAPKRRKRFNITERDIILIRFLVRYQFSYIDALARLLDSSPQTVAARLRTLEQYDLVKRQNIAQGATLWSARKAGIELVGMNFVENKKEISFATIQHTIGLVNLAVELEREAGGKDILGLQGYGEPFPVFNRFPGGIRVYGEDDLAEVEWQQGEMTVAEREIRQGQKRWRGGRSTREMRDTVELAIQSHDAPELEEGNEGLYVVYGQGGATGEHVPDLVVQRPRQADGSPGHFAVELEMTAKAPADWKRILRSFRDSGGMYSRLYYFTDKKPIANMIRNADEEVGLGAKLVIRKYTPRNKRQPFLG